MLVPKRLTLDDIEIGKLYIAVTCTFRTHYFSLRLVRPISDMSLVSHTHRIAVEEDIGLRGVFIEGTLSPLDYNLLPNSYSDHGIFAHDEETLALFETIKITRNFSEYRRILDEQPTVRSERAADLLNEVAVGNLRVVSLAAGRNDGKKRTRARIGSHAWQLEMARRKFASRAEAPSTPNTHP